MAYALAQSGPASEAAQTPEGWTTSASLAVKEEYDSNVFLQDTTPLGNRDSLITTILPSVGVRYTSGPELVARATYAPEINRFHSEPGEDFVLHRIGLGLTGVAGGTEWDWQNSVVEINGSDESLIFSAQGGAPAAGGPRVRDRRDAAIYRGGFKATHPVGKLLVRPAVSVYVHDFQARHSLAPGYLNFVDRNEVTGGVDLGTELAPKVRGFVGYRYGTQDESRLLSFPEEYDNTFHRALFTLEGTPWKWLKASVVLGPEFRTYGDRVPTSFGDHDVVNLFVDATLSITPRPADTISLGVKRFEQPGFGGRATYEDLTYDLSWQHKFGTHWAMLVSGRAYNTEFSFPALRNDWVLGAVTTVSYTFHSKLQAEASFTYEDGESQLPRSSGHDYDRRVAALGLRYTFR